MVMKFRRVMDGKKRRRFTGIAIFTGRRRARRSSSCLVSSAWRSTAFRYSVMVAP